MSPTGSPSDYFLCEERLPLAKERSEARQRPLAPEEEVLRLVSGWHTEEGLVGRISLRAREEVNQNQLNRSRPPHSPLREQRCQSISWLMIDTRGLMKYSFTLTPDREFVD